MEKIEFVKVPGNTSWFEIRQPPLTVVGDHLHDLPGFKPENHTRMQPKAAGSRVVDRNQDVVQAGKVKDNQRSPRNLVPLGH